jgi:hypothetical protein
MAKKRTTRKQLLKGPDEFITQTGKAIRWARANTKPLIYGTCAFAGDSGVQRGLQLLP